MCFPYLFPSSSRVNHFVNSNDMVLTIKASTLLHAEASIIYLPC